MKNILKKATFVIEKNNSNNKNDEDDILLFEITFYDNGEIEITNTKSCSLADNDIYFSPNNNLYSINSIRSLNIFIINT